MMNSVAYLNGSKIVATDGDIGHVKEAYFDDKAWAIRYLVVDTGHWLPGRQVLISPYSVAQPLGSAKLIDVALTRQQVKDSPPVDTHQPVSRRHEREFLSYYTFPEYWGGTELWAMTGQPILPALQPTSIEREAAAAAREQEELSEDFHLRSSAAVTGYDIQATDDSIGHVMDFLFDDESWAIRYLVVDTRNWWPGGRKVLLATQWIDSIEWADRKVFTKLTREEVKNSPKYEEAMPVTRDYEKQLHAAHSRVGYWD